MAYFRHAPLALWSACLLALVALLFVGAAQASSNSAVTVTTMEGADRAEVIAYELVQKSSGMTAASLSGTEGAWSASFATDVLAGLAAYQNGNHQEPELTALWEAAAANAVELSDYKGNEPVKRQALATNLGTSVFALGAYYQSR